MEGLYTEEGELNTIGYLSMMTKSNLKGVRVLELNYEVKRAHNNPYEAAKLLIEAIERDLPLIKAFAEELKIEEL